MGDTIQNCGKESTLTVKWWAILVVIMCVFGFFFTAALSQERRITTLEVQYTAIQSNLLDVKSLTKEIRDDQIRRYEKFEKAGIKY